MTSSLRSCLISVVGDVTIGLLGTAIALLLAYNKLGIDPYYRGFFCDDQTIQYPYRPDTVSDVVAAIVCVLFPAILMLVFEGGIMYTSKERTAIGNKASCKKYGIIAYRTFGVFLAGGFFNILLVEVLKVCTGRLRPNFVSVCEPNYTKINCSLGYVSETDDYCLGANKNRIIDSRKSFPSGHAAMAAYGGIYLLIYLQIRFTWRRIRLLLPLIQLIIVGVVSYISISRVTDFKHHHSDVIAGAIIGIVIASYFTKYVSYLPRYTRRHSPDTNNLPVVNQASIRETKMPPHTSVDITTEM